MAPQKKMMACNLIKLHKVRVKKFGGNVQTVPIMNGFQQLIIELREEAVHFVQDEKFL
jgi:hypothetical protein